MVQVLSRYPSAAVFGRALIESGDLDPVYVVLHGARLDRALLARWLVAYWCVYHAGVASVVASASDFWGELDYVARTSSAPRGRERRHFRGPLAEDTVRLLRARWDGPERWLDELTIDQTSARSVFNRVITEHGFGSWIAFKAVDMIERLGLAPLRFNTDDAGLLSGHPRAAALALAKELRVPGATVDSVETEELAIARVVAQLTTALRDLKAPPRGERAVGVQEVETVLCKWKSHCAGGYPLFHDTRELERALMWDGGPLSRRLLAYLPKEKGRLV